MKLILPPDFPKPAIVRPGVLKPSREDFAKAGLVPCSPMISPTYRRAATISFIAATVQTGDTSPYTFASQSYGTEHPSRRLIIAVSGRNITTQTVTASGNSASFIVGTKAANNFGADLFWLALPAGTSGTIVVNASPTLSNCGIAVWAAYHVKAVVDTSTLSLNGSLDLDVSRDGVGVAVGGCSAATGYVFTGATKRFDQAIEAGNNSYFGGADFTGTLPESPRAVSLVGPVTNSSSCAASFR